MPVAYIASGNKVVPLHYKLHGAEAAHTFTPPTLLTSKHTAHGGQNNNHPQLQQQQPPSQDTYIDIPPQPSPQSLLNGLDGNVEAPKRLILVAAYAAKADTAWASHIITHLSNLKHPVTHQPLVSVLTYDARGVGSSYAPQGVESLVQGEYSTQAMMEDCIGLMEHVGWEKAHVFGWSLGALVALKLAATAPERVESMTLVGASRHGMEMALGMTLWSPLNLLGMMIGPWWRWLKVWTTVRRFFTSTWLNTKIGKKTRREVMIENSMHRERPNLVMDAHATKAGSRGHSWAVITHRLSGTEIKSIQAAGLHNRTLLIHGFDDSTAHYPSGVRLAKLLRCLLVSLPASHAGLMVERADTVLTCLEHAVLGRCVSSQEERKKVQEMAEQKMMETSFFY